MSTLEITVDGTTQVLQLGSLNPAVNAQINQAVTNSAASATAAEGSATAASGSASAAATSASNASSSASAASTSAGSASASATASATSATASATSATASATSATASANAYSAISSGTATSAGTLTGTETIPVSRGSGLRQTTLSNGADYVLGTHPIVDLIAPAYLKTTSDLNAGNPVSMMRFISGGSAAISNIRAGTDFTDRSTDLLNALNAGGTIHYEYGTLNFEASVLPSADNITLNMGRGATLRAQSTLTTPLLKFLSRTKPKVIGGYFDMRNSPAPVAGQVRDALVFDQCIDPYHEGGIFEGVYDPTQPYDTQPSHGDSGTFLSACTRGKIIGATYIRMPDCGIYVNATPSPSIDAQLIGCHFYQCYTAIANKRNTVGTMIIGAQMNNCYHGITTEAASDGPIPGKQVYIDSMRAVNCYYPLILRWADHTIVKAPYIQNAIGTETASAGAIWFQGTQYATVSDPTISSDTQYPTMTAAIFLDDRTEFPPVDPVNAPTIPGPAVDRMSLYNQIHGGTLTNFLEGVRENDGTKADYNYVWNPVIVGAQDEGSTVDLRGAHSIYRKTDLVNQVEKQSGDKWWTTPSMHHSFRSIDGGTWNKGIIGGDTVDFWYQNQYRVAQANSSGLSLDKDLIMGGQIRLKTYTVATLPSSSMAPGYVAFASNGRKVGEGAGAGTGVSVYWSSGWKVFGTDAAVAA